MQIITRTRDRIIVAVLLLIIIFAALNVLFSWGFFGEKAMGVALVAAFAGVVISRLLTPGVTFRTIFDARNPEADHEAKDSNVDQDSK